MNKKQYLEKRSEQKDSVRTKRDSKRILKTKLKIKRTKTTIEEKNKRCFRRTFYKNLKKMDFEKLEKRN